jgi:oligopeptide transport system ATP-binding protein
MEAPLLQVSGLVKDFPVRGTATGRGAGVVRVLDGITFHAVAGETLALVGESGCGKTTTARCILRLIEPTSGSIVFDGVELTGLPRRALRRVRKHVGIVFQDPYGSLNPRLRALDVVREPLRIHGMGDRRQQEWRAQELLERVGLDPRDAHKMPWELSGGQQQRLGIARALALDPKLVICDEPVSSLDVSIRAQILNLLRDLQREFGITYLFISHDIRVVQHVADHVVVMYLGAIVEEGPVDRVFSAPRHPYTRALMRSVPSLAAWRERPVREPLEGDPGDAAELPPGCRFHPRCPRFRPGVCDIEQPQLRETEDDDGRVACFFPLEVPRIGDDVPASPIGLR